MATTAYLAGTDTNDLELSFAAEDIWGTSPTGVHYQKFRVNSESFSEQKTRSRPPELRNDWQSAPMTTQDVQASGSLQFGISYGNTDALIAGALTGAWAADLAISGDDISFDASTNTIESVTAGKFANVVLGQHIRVAGASNAGNNGFFRVVTKPDNLTLGVDGDLTTEAAGEDITISGSMLRNAKVFNAFSIQKRFAPNLGFIYPGTFFSGGQINASRGQFFSGQLDALCKAEVKAAAAVGTGFDAAPNNRVLDSVGNFKGLILDDLPSAVKIMSLNTTFTREGAAMAFAMGSKAAAGVGSVGSLAASGTMQVYFEDYEFYDAYDNEDAMLISYRVTDNLGNSYIVSVPQLVLGQSQIVAGGPNQPVMAQFNWAADPSETLGCSIQIDRFGA
jgi:hypothetical protein